MNERQTGFNRSMKLLFGIFMVFVYMGMAALLAVNYFEWSQTPLWNGVRWFFVVLFAAYGIYRGYREVKGEHTYGMRRYDDEIDYGTYSKSPIDNENQHDEKK